MNEHLDPTGSNLSNTEREMERKLRPLSFDDFTGQAVVLENLKIFVEAAKMRDEAMDHVLLHGPPGLGKTTLSHILANELSVGIKVTSGPVLDKPSDLAGLLTICSQMTYCSLMRSIDCPRSLRSISTVLWRTSK